MAHRLLIYGASGHGKVAADAALLSGWEVAGFVDDDPEKLGRLLLGIPVRAAGLEEAVRLCRSEGAAFVVAVGDNAIRRRIYLGLAEAGLSAALVVHPTASIASSASVGPGTVVFAQVAVNSDSRVGANTILNTSCTVDHDNTIGDHVHLSPGVHLGGTVAVGEGAHIGLGASVRNDTSIGAWSVVGMGSVVVQDIPERVTAYGVPARVIRART